MRKRLYFCNVKSADRLLHGLTAFSSKKRVDRLRHGLTTRFFYVFKAVLDVPLEVCFNKFGWQYLNNGFHNLIVLWTQNY